MAGGAYFDQIAGALPNPACGGAGCWTNHLRLTDIDGDDDLDLLLPNYPDFFNGSASQQAFVVYTNDGDGTFTNASATAVDGFVGSLRQIAVGDVDADGDVDIYAPQGGGQDHAMFINDGAGVFDDEADTRLPAESPVSAATRMGDVDNDGDLDIFVADGYGDGGAAASYGHVYVNDGTGVFTELADAVPGDIDGNDIDDVEFFDMDRDFDLDLFVNAHNGGTGGLWVNDGTGVFTEGGSIPNFPGANHYNPGVCDVDGDGDLDMWIDNVAAGYNEALLTNDGAGNFTNVTAAQVSGNNGGNDDNGVVCVDVDLDGDFDAVVVSLGASERLLENDGSGNFSAVPGAMPGPGDCSLWAEFGDLDDDDRIDFVTGSGECSSAEYVFRGNSQIPVDRLAPQIITVESISNQEVGSGPTVRFAVADSTVTDEGPHLDRAFAVLFPGTRNETADAVFMGGDLYRVEVPAQGLDVTVTLQLCATDRAGNLGCSDEITYDEGAGGVPPSDTGDSTDGGTGESSGGADTSGGPVDDTGTDPTTGGNGSSGDGAIGETGGATTGGAETDTDTSGADEEGSGCGCRETTPAGGAWWAVLAVALGLRARRRRYACPRA
jgi:hypothetical protein